MGSHLAAPEEGFFEEVWKVRVLHIICLVAAGLKVYDREPRIDS
jgi:hypothetical protein